LRIIGFGNPDTRKFNIEPSLERNRGYLENRSSKALAFITYIFYAVSSVQATDVIGHYFGYKWTKAHSPIPLNGPVNVYKALHVYRAGIDENLDGYTYNGRHPEVQWHQH
jgi:hypothetical protein